jgi:hypothetical protein
MKRVRYFVREKSQKQFEGQAPFQCRDRIRASQPVICLKLTRETFESEPMVSNTTGSNVVMKRRNQISVYVAPDLWCDAKPGRDRDHNFLKSLGCARAIVQLALNMPERPWPHSFRHFMNPRIDGPILIVSGSNPEGRNPA